MAKRGRKKKFKINFNVSRETLRSIVAVLLLLLSVVSLISFLAPNYLLNEKIQLVFKLGFGWGSIVIPFITALTGLLFIDAINHKIKELRVIIGLVVLLITLSGFIHIFISAETARQLALDGNGGGFIGYLVANSLKALISIYGGIFVLLAFFILSFILIFDVSLDKVIEFYKIHIKEGGFKKLFNFKKGSKDQVEISQGVVDLDDDDIADDDSTYYGDDDQSEESKADFEILPPMSEPQIDMPAEIQKIPRGKVGTIAPSGLPYPDKVWALPSVDLLSDVGGGPPDTSDVEENKKQIKDTLESFSIPIEIADTQVGPSVTKYALKTPKGIKVAKIANLQYDLAMALKSPTGSVRIEAPIPGKSWIGIEVPNRTRVQVNFKSLITSDQIKAHKSKLAIVLGKDVGGVTHVYDIGKMPHLLIAGQTGSGKSVFIHNLIFSILYRATPQEVKFIMVDPKKVELSAYRDIPHLYTPIVTDYEKSPAVFKWAVTEMRRRYQLFESAKARNIEIYNEKSGFQALPYIVIIVDELAEIMIADPASVEKSIIRIAQLARATGIHLILAAQRPEARVITGLIKANIPCRIAFSVAGQVDSRVIIDQTGAEKLLGAGDMLFIPPDKPTPIRLQGANVTDSEITAVVNFLKGQGVPPNYKEEIFEVPSDEDQGKSIAAGGEAVDDLYDEAVEAVIAAKKGSASLLQRRLSIGYARAARILDELEKNGIVGAAQGSKPRDLLISASEAEGSSKMADIDEYDDEDDESYEDYDEY